MVHVMGRSVKGGSSDPASLIILEGEKGGVRSDPAKCTRGGGGERGDGGGAKSLFMTLIRAGDGKEALGGTVSHLNTNRGEGRQEGSRRQRNLYPTGVDPKTC